MDVLKELRSIASDRATRTMPMGTITPGDTLEGMAADEIERLRAGLDAIRQYGSDTLSGRVDGPDDREWQREAVVEMTKRAAAALTN